MIVTTLPVSPKFDRGLASYTSAFVADMFGRWSGADLLMPVNLVSRVKPYSRNKADSDFRTYNEILDRLGIKPKRTWRDDTAICQAAVQTSLEKLYLQKALSVEHLSVLRCPCGIVEVPVANLPTFYNARLITSSDGQSNCSKCGQGAKAVETEGLVMAIPLRQSVDFDLIPSFWRKDTASLVGDFLKKKIVVSRCSVVPESREILGVSLGGRNYDLDPVFRWANFLLELDDADHIILVVGSRIISYAVFVILYSMAVSPRKITFSIIVHPSVSFNDEKGTLQPFIHELLENYSGSDLRFLLGTGMVWAKEATINSSLLHRIRLMVDQGRDPTTLVPSRFIDQEVHRSFTQWFNASTVKGLVAKVRKAQDITQNELQLFSALQAARA